MKHNRRHVTEKSTTQLIRILLAEDDYEMRKLIAWALARNGYEVTECADGTTLMKKLGLTRHTPDPKNFDLIISDIRMPGTSGLQVLESVREFPDFPPMILITAFPDQDARDQARRLGAVAMIAKPFDMDELLATVVGTVPPERTQKRVHAQLQASDSDTPPFPVVITFRHHDGTEAVRDYVRRVIAKLYPFADHIVNCKVVIDSVHPQEFKKHEYAISLVLATAGRSIVVKHDTGRSADRENLFMGINVVAATACKNLKQYMDKKTRSAMHGKGRTFEDVETDVENDSWKDGES
jgi:DNA-binding response OmpR family regulator